MSTIFNILSYSFWAQEVPSSFVIAVIYEFKYSQNIQKFEEKLCHIWLINT
jgi:hypothetical protein